MPHFKWSLVVLLVFFPLMFLLAEYISHSVIKADSDTATRQAAQVALKEGVLKGSLRDTDIDPTLYTAVIDVDKVTSAYDDSFKESKSVKGTVINPAERDESIGISNNPPMIAIRSNVVRESLLYNLVSTFIPDKKPAYVLQNQKITILEAKQTEPIE